ncbi:hypothetical protein [Maricaulis parjimensis]|uniref:hypothetical protein n=1 Tax=Maricaulis parjimensis TaxID=144023 RepID=UPI00193ACB2E|nr:hypothetical protein [Maricaulis parjimensis]
MRVRDYLKTAFSGLVILVLSPPGLGSLALADTPASPAGQVYEAQALGVDTGYVYRFLADGTLQVDQGFGATPPRYSDGHGTWEMAADGSVTITAQNVEMMPDGAGTVTCQAWPDVPVGFEFQDMPCWWPAEEPSGPLIRRE